MDTLLVSTQTGQGLIYFLHIQLTCCEQKYLMVITITMEINTMQTILNLLVHYHIWLDTSNSIIFSTQWGYGQYFGKNGNMQMEHQVGGGSGLTLTDCKQ